MKFGLGFMRHTNQQDSQYLVDYAMLSDSTNYFEIAPFYLNNNCENYVYNLIKKYNRHSYQICQKMPIKEFLQKNNFQKTYEQQLKKVPGNYFDTYLLQSLSHESFYYLYNSSIIPFFLEEKKKGNIQKFGFSDKSNYSTFHALLNLHCWDVIQTPINYIDWRFGEGKKKYLDLITYKNIDIIAQAPLRGGTLPLLESISFLKQLPKIDRILTGTTNLNHYKNLLYAYNNNDKQYNYDLLQNQWKEQNIIPCTQCNQCFYSCNYNVPIMSLFKLYNEVLNEKENAYEYLTFLKNNGNITLCRKCKHYQCEKQCPNHIPIHKKLNYLYLYGA